MSRLGNGWADNAIPSEKGTEQHSSPCSKTQAVRETTHHGVQCLRPPKPRVAGSNPASRASLQPNNEPDSPEGMKSPRLGIRWATAKAALPARVRSKVAPVRSKVAPARGGCWLWTAARISSGYGKLRVGSLKDGTRREVMAHRFVYEALVGPIPDGLVIDHLCRNRACVNPAHLEPVTVKQNTLRGKGLTAAFARRTHCPAGHALGDRDGEGYRRCQTCRTEKARARAAKGPPPPAGSPMGADRLGGVP